MFRRIFHQLLEPMMVDKLANSWWMKKAAQNTHHVVTKYGDELGKQAAKLTQAQKVAQEVAKQQALENKKLLEAARTQASESSVIKLLTDAKSDLKTMKGVLSQDLRDGLNKAKDRLNK